MRNYFMALLFVLLLVIVSCDGERHYHIYSNPIPGHPFVDTVVVYDTTVIIPENDDDDDDGEDEDEDDDEGDDSDD